MANFDDWLSEQLNRLDIDAEVYGEYVKGIMGDTEQNIEERVTTVSEILSSALPEEVDLTPFQSGLTDEWTKVEREMAQEQAQKLKAKKDAEEKVLEEEKQKSIAAQQARDEKAKSKKKLSREELALREKVLQEYGFEEESAFDENGHFVSTGPSSTGRASAENDESGGNRNKQLVKDHQKQQREISKTQHEQKVKRDKELLVKDKARKEARKKKTVKKEKQRGCG